MSRTSHNSNGYALTGEITIVRPKESLPANNDGRPSTIAQDSIQALYFDKIRSNQRDLDKYQLLDKIAEGGMGSIHQVYDKNLQRYSVVKIILPNIGQDPQLFRQFVKEAQITARLEHPNIIPVHDIGVMGADKLNFVMKEVQGDSLAKILRKIKEGAEHYRERFSQFALLTIFRKICDAVAYAHSCKIIHRDIKPDNIMIGNFGEVLLMDWGLAKRLEEHEEPPSSAADNAINQAMDLEATLSGLIKGTPAFMSPEQASGDAELVNELSDIFLLGSTLYCIATLQAPYSGKDIEEILHNAQQGNALAMESPDANKKIPAELSRIILKAMAIDPAQRYPNAQALIDDVDSFLQGNTSTTTKTYVPGEMIIKEGEIGEEAFVINTGLVEVYKSGSNGDEFRLGTLGPGDVIGEMALISKSPRSASIRALKNTDLVLITQEVMEQGLEQLPPWLRTTVDCLTERLVNVNQQVHPLLSGDCTYHVLQQLASSYLLMGESTSSDQSSTTILTANTQRTVTHIANTLCISSDRVEALLSGLQKQNVIHEVDASTFSIPSIQLLDKLITRAGKNLSIDTENTLDSPFVSNALENLNMLAASDVLACDNEQSVDEKISEILVKLRTPQ